jgi:hypothetical protein
MDTIRLSYGGCCEHRQWTLKFQYSVHSSPRLNRTLAIRIRFRSACPMFLAFIHKLDRTVSQHGGVPAHVGNSC